MRRTTKRAVDARGKHSSSIFSRRDGGLLVELMGAVVVMSAAFAIAVPVIGKTGALRRQAEQRQLALQEAANLMERVAALPWNDISQETLKKLELSATARRSLRSPQLGIELAKPVGPVPTKQVVIQVRWRDATGHPVRPVWLVAWFYQRRGAP